MTGRRVVVEGVGLHSGAPARVTLERRDGPVILVSGALEARVSALEVASTARSTTVEAHGGALRVGTVEHAFAALAGLGVYEGVALVVEGPEMPLLDGGAAAWCEALAELGAPSRRPGLRVARHATLEVGASRYELSTGTGIDVEVCVEFDDPRIARRARWTGDADDFRARVASARTFAFARDLDELARQGLARHADPGSVVVLAPEQILSAGRLFASDEPARHKLLDLMGDLYLRGGPPVGRFRAVRPGHSANARALRRALDEGVLVPA